MMPIAHYRRGLLAVCLALLTTGFTAASAETALEAGTPPVQLASVYALVGDLSTGEVLYGKHPDIPVPIASVTKLMTAMVVLDSKQSLDEWIPVMDWAENPEKNAYSRLRVGSEVRRGDLLRIAVMSSENLASNTLARHYPGDVPAFVAAMNAKAAQLGMSNASFADPTGLSTGNTASARDLWKMILAAYQYDVLRDYSTTYQHSVSFRNPRYSLAYGNTNPLTASSRWDVRLSKTGYLSESGRCLAMVADIGGSPVAMILLNSLGTRSPLGDAGRVRRWLETGEQGSVAGAARDYEREKSRALPVSATELADD